MAKIHLPARSKPRSDLEQRIVVAQVLGSAPAQQQDGFVVLDADLVESNVGFEPIAPAFNIGVPTGLEIVHHQVQAAAGGCGHDGLPAFLLEAVDGVESFVGFAAIAGDDEDFRHASNLARSAAKFTAPYSGFPFLPILFLVTLL